MWYFILDFIMEHPEMATGKFEGPKLWNNFVEKLNSLGCDVKTATK